MSENMNHIDNLFKEAIEAHESVPSDNVWYSIEGRLQQRTGQAKEGTIKNLRYTVLGLTAVFGVFVAYHYYQPSQENKEVAQKARAKNAVVVAAENSGPAATTIKVAESKNVTAPITQNKKEQEPAVINEIVPENTSYQKDPQQLASDFHAAFINDKKTDEDAELKKLPVQKNVQANADKENTLLSDAQKKESVQGQSSDAGKKKDAEIAAFIPESKEGIVYVPNAFTPNGDGLNDTFLPKAAEEPKEYKLFIYDCRGTLVFYSDDINKGWDGRTQVNGVETVKEDAYMWRMEIKNNKGEKERTMGYITLLK